MRHRLSHGWGQLLIPGLLIIRKEVEFVRDHWRDAWNFIKAVGETFLNWYRGSLVAKIVSGISDLVGRFGSFRSSLSSIFSRIRSDIASAWNTIWNNTVARVRSGVASVVSFIGSLPGKIKSAFSSAGSWLLQAGKNVIQGLWNGLTSIWNKLTGWISGIASWIKAHKGPISLDQQLLYPAGQALMSGLFNGLKAGFGPVGSFVGGIASFVLGKIKGAGGKLLDGKVVLDTSQFSAGNLIASVGSGVQRWRGLVLQALKMEGLPTSLVNMILTQMQSESGGNPNAINLWDSNAKAGHPSKGLMQVIGPTFAAYHWPGTSGNIYDPLANIAAALNYAAHNRGFGSGPGQVGSGHGYASGGIAGGGLAMVGERGRELLQLPAGSRVYNNAQTEGMLGGGAVTVQLEISGGQSEFDRFMTRWIKEDVRIKGGGNVQTAFGYG